MVLPTPGVTPANWGAQLNAEITAASNGEALVWPAGATLTLNPGLRTGVYDPNNIFTGWITPVMVMCHAPQPIDRIGVEVNATSGTLGMARYTLSSGVLTRVVDYGTATTTVAGVQLLTVSDTLPVGRSWIAVSHTGQWTWSMVTDLHGNAGPRRTNSSGTARVPAWNTGATRPTTLAATPDGNFDSEILILARAV